MTDRKPDDQPAVTPPVIRLAAAEVDAVAARDRLSDTTARLQSKLDPKLLGKEALNEARAVGDKGVAFASDNRSVLGGLAGGVLLYLIGRPLLGLFKRRKGPKPQKAARPMTATTPNDRLARSPHPTAPAAPAPMIAASPHPTMTPATPAPVQASNEGALTQGTMQ